MKWFTSQGSGFDEVEQMNFQGLERETRKQDLWSSKRDRREKPEIGQTWKSETSTTRQHESASASHRARHRRLIAAY